MADTPAASPSKPSVKFAPLDTAVIIKVTIRIYTIQVYFSAPGPIQLIILL